MKRITLITLVLAFLALVAAPVMAWTYNCPKCSFDGGKGHIIVKTDQGNSIYTTMFCPNTYITDASMHQKQIVEGKRIWGDYNGFVEVYNEEYAGYDKTFTDPYGGETTQAGEDLQLTLSSGGVGKNCPTLNINTNIDAAETTKTFYQGDSSGGSMGANQKYDLQMDACAKGEDARTYLYAEGLHRYSVKHGDEPSGNFAWVAGSIHVVGQIGQLPNP
jgi:hypothetical protein